MATQKDKSMAEMVAERTAANRRERDAENESCRRRGEELESQRKSLEQAVGEAVAELVGLPNVERAGPTSIKVFWRYIHVAVQEVHGTFRPADDVDPQPYTAHVVRWTRPTPDARPCADQYTQGGQSSPEDFREAFAKYVADELGR